MAKINANTVNDLCNHNNTTYTHFCNSNTVDISDHRPVESIVDGMKILSFNIAGNGISYYRREPQAEERANIPIRIRHICDFIKFANYDIICLQEVTNDINDSIINEQLKGIYTRYQNPDRPVTVKHYNVIFVKTTIVNETTDLFSDSICVENKDDKIERCNTLRFTYKGTYYHIINCKFPNTDIQIIDLIIRIMEYINTSYNYNNPTFIIAGDLNINNNSTARVRGMFDAFNYYLTAIGIIESTIAEKKHNDYIFTTSRPPATATAQGLSKKANPPIPSSTTIGKSSRERSRSPKQATQQEKRQSLAVAPATVAPKQVVAPAAAKRRQSHQQVPAKKWTKKELTASGTTEGRPYDVDTYDMFYAKYLKYKQKYLELKNQHMG